MIARLWSARTADPEHADAYQELFPVDALELLGTLPGFRGAYLLRREDEAGTEFVTMTLFDSLDAVRDFAGHSYHRANVSPPAREILDDVDERVRHFTVVATPQQRVRPGHGGPPMLGPR